jgi:hypothetical protein
MGVPSAGSQTAGSQYVVHHVRSSLLPSSNMCLCCVAGASSNWLIVPAQAVTANMSLS